MKNRLHHYKARRIWKGLRDASALIGTAVWLYTEMLDVVMVFAVLTVAINHFEGWICNRIEKLRGWEQDFDDME